jgi:hypothetical protein
MSEMDKQLPPYFKEYLEQKFTALHDAIRDNKKAHDEDIVDMAKTLDEVRLEQKWASGMIKGAVGGLAVISVAGVVLSLYFKTLNRQQIEEAIQAQKIYIATEVVDILEDKYNLKIK